MDKYEYNLKLDQMKSRYAEEKYDEAADIADTINWNKVKNVNGLVKAGEVYEKVQRYEESREVLLMAYDRASALFLTAVYGLNEAVPELMSLAETMKIGIIVGGMVLGGILISLCFTFFAVNKFVNMKSNKIYLY